MWLFVVALARATVVLDPEGLEDAMTDVSVIRVTARPDDTCVGPVAIEAWRDEFARSRALLARLDMERAVGVLSGLGIDVVCVDRALGTSDLVALEVTTAEAHLILAQSVADPVVAEQHATEARAALTRAVVYSGAAAAPPDLDPGRVDDWGEARDAVARLAPVSVHVAGPGAGVGARVNGHAIPDAPFLAPPGQAVVLATGEGGAVAASSFLRFEPGSRAIVWLDPGGTRVDLLGAAEAVVAGEASPRQSALVRAALEALGAWRGVEHRLGAPRADVAGGAVEAAPEAPSAVADGPARVGVGGGFGWSGVRGGALDGMSGANGSVTLRLGARIREGLWAVATASPWAHWQAVDGATLYRAAVPLRAGVRFSTSGARALEPEAGVDLGAALYGRFPDGTAPVGFVALAVAGLGVRVADPGLLHLEVHGGVSAGAGATAPTFGGTISLEVRP